METRLGSRISRPFTTLDLALLPRSAWSGRGRCWLVERDWCTTTPLCVAQRLRADEAGTTAGPSLSLSLYIYIYIYIYISLSQTVTTWELDVMCVCRSSCCISVASRNCIRYHGPSFVIHVDDVVRRRGYCDQLVTMCACGWVRGCVN